MSLTTISFQNLQECVVLCRPQNTVSFCVRYFRDEQASNPAVAHAEHCLPFVICDENAFRQFAATIYSFELVNQNGSRDTIDASVVIETLQRMRSDWFVWNSAIQQIVTEYIEPLKEFTFETFLASVRLVLSCNVVGFWTDQTLEEFRYLNGNTVLSKGDISQLLTYVKQKSRRNKSRRQVPDKWRNEDDELWETTLEQILTSALSSSTNVDHKIEFAVLKTEMILHFVSAIRPKSKK